MEAIYLTSQQLLTTIVQSSVITLLAYTTLFFCLVQFLKSTVYTPFKVYFLAQYLPGVDLKKLGKWAVVTGATDGIGKEYAKALANRGLHIILISRSQDKLSTVAEDIKNKYDVQVQTIAVNFTHTDIYNKIEKSLEGLDIAILVNNVGITTRLCTFLNIDDILQSTVDLVNVNCVAMTNMCALVLPRMLEKKKGVIVNISSLVSAGFIATPTYSATKAYVSMFSEMLQRTYRNSGIIIQTLEPGMVLTPMVMAAFAEGRPRIQFMEMAKQHVSVSVQAYVESAINTIGQSDKCQGHFKHFIVSLFDKLQSNPSKDRAILDQIPE